MYHLGSFERLILLVNINGVRETLELICVIGHVLANPKNKLFTGGLIPDELQAILNVNMNYYFYLLIFHAEIHSCTFGSVEQQLRHRSYTACSATDRGTTTVSPKCRY